MTDTSEKEEVKPCVEVFLSTPLSEQGKKDQEYQASNMLELMETLFFEHEDLENLVMDNGHIADYIKLFLNDREVDKDYSEVSEIDLEDGDEISLIASVSGGERGAPTATPVNQEAVDEDSDEQKEITLKDFVCEILQKKEEGEVSFHKRKDQRYPVTIVQRMLAELDPDEVSEIFSEYKDLFSPSMLGVTSGQSWRSHSPETVNFVKDLNPEDKAYMAKQEIKNMGTCKRTYRGGPTMNIEYDVTSEEFFDELTSLQTAKFIIGQSRKAVNQLVEDIGIEFFKGKMKKLIFKKSDERAKRALEKLKDNEEIEK